MSKEDPSKDGRDPRIAIFENLAETARRRARSPQLTRRQRTKAAQGAITAQTIIQRIKDGKM